MNEELLSALKIAISHGTSLDDAINSFISAGYSAQEVREAAQELNGITPHLSPVAQPPTPQLKKEPAPTPALPPKQPVQLGTDQVHAIVQPLPVQKLVQTQASSNEEHSGWVKWIVAYLIVFVLIILIGLGILVFKPDLLSGLFGTNSWP